MATSVQKKLSGMKGNGGVRGAIVPPSKVHNCSFDYVSDDSSLENEDALKVANDIRVDELLSKAAFSMKNPYVIALASFNMISLLHFSPLYLIDLDFRSKAGSSNEEADRKSALEVLRSLELARNQKETWKVSE